MNDDGEPKIELGPVCPPVKSWFFPNDPELKPKEIDEEKNGDDTTQST